MIMDIEKAKRDSHSNRSKMTKLFRSSSYITEVDPKQKTPATPETPVKPLRLPLNKWKENITETSSGL
jgi:hypothetical protein